MHFNRSFGCIFGLISVVVFVIFAIIALIILLNVINSFDYRTAAEDIKNGLQDFNSTLRSINPSVPETTVLTTIIS